MTVDITILLTKHCYICLIRRLQLFDNLLKHGNINVWALSWFSSRALSTWSAVFSRCSWTTSATTRSWRSCLSSRTRCPWLPRGSWLSWWTLRTCSIDIFIGWLLVIHFNCHLRNANQSNFILPDSLKAHSWWTIIYSKGGSLAKRLERCIGASMTPRWICSRWSQVLLRRRKSRFMKQKVKFPCAWRFFCTFLWNCYTTTTSKCLISRFMEDVNKRRRNFLSLSKLDCSLQEINSREIWLH